MFILSLYINTKRQIKKMHYFKNISLTRRFKRPVRKIYWDLTHTHKNRPDQLKPKTDLKKGAKCMHFLFVKLKITVPVNPATSFFKEDVGISQSCNSRQLEFSSSQIKKQFPQWWSHQNESFVDVKWLRIGPLKQHLDVDSLWRQHHRELHLWRT